MMLIFKEVTKMIVVILEDKDGKVLEVEKIEIGADDNEEKEVVNF